MRNTCIHMYTYVKWHILLHNVNDRSGEQVEIVHVARGGGQEGWRENEGENKYSFGDHRGDARRTFHNPRDRFDINFVDLIKIHGFRQQSVCTAVVDGSDRLGRRRASWRRRRLLRRSFHPIGVEFSYEIYAKRSQVRFLVWLRCYQGSPIEERMSRFLSILFERVISVEKEEYQNKNGETGIFDFEIKKLTMSKKLVFQEKKEMFFLSRYSLI